MPFALESTEYLKYKISLLVKPHKSKRGVGQRHERSRLGTSEVLRQVESGLRAKDD